MRVCLPAQVESMAPAHSNDYDSYTHLNLDVSSVGGGCTDCRVILCRLIVEILISKPIRWIPRPLNLIVFALFLRVTNHPDPRSERRSLFLPGGLPFRAGRGCLQ